MKIQNVLYDVHGCLADYIGGYVEFMNLNYPHLGWAREHVVTWDLISTIPDPEAQAHATRQMLKSTFVVNLPIIPEAVVAYERLVDIGHDVRVCTTPLPGEHEEISKKAVKEWVKINLGISAAQKMIFSHDKTLEPADVIVDDKPVLTQGKTHIKFKHWLIVDHLYNRELPEDSGLLPVGRINNDWSNWEEEFEKLGLL